ncbi:MAG: SCO family protein [Gemmataceae bacterium]|nr:SCO family protein [Gemmataceae bacterium]
MTAFLLLSLLCADDALADKGRFFTSRLGERLPADLAFTDETGKKVALGDYRGKPFILVMAWYKCPRLCTLVLNDLVKGLRGIPFDVGREFDVVVASYDPTEPPALAKAKKDGYAEDYGRPGTEGGWHFLTGDKASIDALGEACGFRAVWDGKQYAHGRGIAFITPNLLVARYSLDGTFPPRDLRLALIESSEGRVGSPMDRVLLMCFNYDPVTGAYSVAVLRLVQAGGLLTLAALALFWWRATRNRTNTTHTTHGTQAEGA